MSAKIRRVCAKRVTADLTRFLQLVDTPDTYENQAGKFAVVNPTEDGIIFVDVAGLDLEFLDDQTIYTCPSTTDIRDAVHIPSAGTVVIADKTITSNLPIIGLVVAKPTATSCIIQTLGFLEGFTGLVPGDTYYLHTDGKITNTPTVTPGEALYVIGVAKSSSKLELRIGSDYIIRS
jgi:hypothetical protein